MSALDLIAKIDRLKKLRAKAMAANPPKPGPTKGPPPSFRAFLESPDFCDLTLSPLIAAIADASDGTLVTTLGDDACTTYFGCAPAGLPVVQRRTVAIRAGGRGGKTSRLLAPKAIHAAWTVDLPTLNPGEVAVALIVAPDLKLGRQAFSFVKGYVDASPVLRAALVGKPRKMDLELRRPDGKIVRIEVLAATRGGGAVRARTLVFAGMDEACFFFSEDDGVVNDSEIFRAVLQRVVPGGQAWIVSTPWVADVGLLETTLAKNWGTHEYALCATAPTRAMNPTWDPTGEIENDLREQDPDAATREIDAIPLAGGSNQFFDPFAIKDAIVPGRPLKVPARAKAIVGFGGDLAFASDSSALAGVDRVPQPLAEGGVRLGDSYSLLVIDELRPAKGLPLKPSAVIAQFAETLLEYGAASFVADDHYKETAREHLDPHEIAFIAAPPKNEPYLLTKKLLHEGRLLLPDNKRLKAQLQSVVSRPLPGGGFSISSPRKKGGGHGDLVSALVLAVWAAARARTPGGKKPPRPPVHRFDETPIG